MELFWQKRSNFLKQSILQMYTYNVSDIMTVKKKQDFSLKCSTNWEYLTPQVILYEN